MKRIIAAAVGAAALVLTMLAVPSASAATVTVQAGMKYGNVNMSNPSSNAHGIKDFCTLGAVGYDADGNKVGLTAGHCSEGNTAQWAAKSVDGKFLGVVATARTDYNVGILEYDKFDYGFILFADNVVFADDPATAVNPQSIGTPASWQRVCKFGHAPLQPGEKCGTSVGNRPIEFDITAASFFGDSGGPVYRPSAPTVLLGVISRPAMPGLTTVQRADAASADALANGSIGGGFQPVA